MFIEEKYGIRCNSYNSIWSFRVRWWINQTCCINVSKSLHFHMALRYPQALHTYRINLSPFTKDFRVWGAPIETNLFLQSHFRVTSIKALLIYFHLMIRFEITRLFFIFNKLFFWFTFPIALQIYTEDSTSPSQSLKPIVRRKAYYLQTPLVIKMMGVDAKLINIFRIFKTARSIDNYW